MRMIRRICLIAGAFLLILNFSGFYYSLRSDNLDQIAIVTNQISPIDSVEFWSKINAAEKLKMSSKLYAEFISQSVDSAMIHYWDDNPKVELQVPASENYVLWMLGELFPSGFKKYEFKSYKKALERGVGLCSQHAIIVSGILNDKNIPTSIIGLGGHVVAMAEVSNGDVILNVLLDADNGVTLPFSLSEVEKSPELIKPYYLRAGYDSKKVDELVQQYGKDGNQVFKIETDYFKKKFWLNNWIEVLAYLIKWILPITLLCFVYFRQLSAAVVICCRKLPFLHDNSEAAGNIAARTSALIQTTKL